MSCSLRLQELICFVSSVMMPFHSEVQCLRCLRCLHPGFRLFPQARSKNWFEASVASDRRLLSICDVAGNGPGKEVGGSNDVMTLERMIFVAVMFHVSNHFCTPKAMYKAQTHGVLQWPCLLSGVLVGGLGTTLARRVLWDAQVVRNFQSWLCDWMLAILLWLHCKPWLDVISQNKASKKREKIKPQTYQVTPKICCHSSKPALLARPNRVAIYFHNFDHTLRPLVW